MAALAVLMLASCGFTGRVPRTLKIGLSAPFEGLYRDLGYEALYAVRLAVRERNEAGALSGRYLIELVALNDFNEPSEAVRQAAELAADPDVVAAIGGLSPVTAAAAAPAYRRHGLLLVAPQAGWDLVGAAAGQVAARRLSLHRATILASDDGAHQSLADAFAAEFAAQGGSVVAQDSPAEAVTVAVLLASTTPEPDLLFVAADAPTAAIWIAEARRSGFAGVILGGPEVGSSLVVDIAGSASDGVLFVSPFPPQTEEGALVDGYRALSGGAAPGPVAFWAYTSAGAALDAVEAAVHAPGGPSRPMVAQALLTRPAEPVLFVYAIRGDRVFTPQGSWSPGPEARSPCWLPAVSKQPDRGGELAIGRWRRRCES